MKKRTWAKRLGAYVLSLSLMVTCFGVGKVEAAEDKFVFDQKNCYAIAAVDEEGKIADALNVKATGWQTHTTVDGMVMGNGDATYMIGETSQILIVPSADQSGLDNNETRVNLYYPDKEDGEKPYPMRAEGGNDFLFADADKRKDCCEYIITKTGEQQGIIRDTTRNYYFTIKANGEVVRVPEKANATSFRFIENPEIGDFTYYIEHQATGKNIRAVETNAPLRVDGEIGDDGKVADDQRWTVVWGDFNGTTAAFVSKGIPNTRWRGGQTEKITLINGNSHGGWESIRIVPNGDGTVSFRDTANGKYFTVKDGEIIRTENSDTADADGKFVIHSLTSPKEVSDIKISSVEDTSVIISWTGVDDTFFTGYQVKATPVAETGKKEVISQETTETTMKLTGLEKSTEYQIKVLTVNGPSPSAEADGGSIQTKNGPRPKSVTEIHSEKDKQGNKIVWKEVKEASGYNIYRAVSAYVSESSEYTYQKINGDTPIKGTSYIDQTVNKEHTMSACYKVTAVNENGESELSDVYTSLEKEMFGEHTLIFSPTDDPKQVDQILGELFTRQNDFQSDAQFKGEQYQIYFKPGDYTETSCINLGFYTSVNGLGKTPYEVKLNNIAIPAYLPAGELGGDGNNATCNFWRSAENLSIINTGNSQGNASFGSWRPGHFNWAVAQAAPLRRVYSTRPVSYDWNYGWASGGYVADCKFEGTFEDNGNQLCAGTFSGQQFYTRNSELSGDAFGTTLNNFFQGVEAPNLPNAESGQPLVKGNGYSNWGIAAEGGGQQVVTNVETAPKISEKPFLYLDEQGEYQVFVPAVRTNARGISWSENNMGEGKSIPLSDFYIAKPDDTAAKINQQLEKGKNIYFTPGTYHAEEPIQVNKDNTILLGTGMTSIIPDNKDTAMMISDNADGVRVAGIIFDAGKESEYLLKVGEKKENNHASNPTILQDLFFRVGGTTDTLTKAKNALEINSNDVIADHFWIWRADHGAGVEWYGNESDHGIIVNGDNVVCYALFNEHFQKYDTLWNGENGATYFYQNEKCYDPISQDAWMSHDKKVKGYAAYKVADHVKKHYAVGLGVYNVLIYTGEEYDSSRVQIEMDHAIEVPNQKEVLIENACLQTFADDTKVLQKFNHIVNGAGDGVSSGFDWNTGEFGEGWSRKFLLSYQDGTAVVGISPDESSEFNKFIGIETIQNVKEAGNEESAVPQEPSLEEPTEENRNNPYNTWKRAAILTPERGQLKAAGPVTITWKALDDKKVKSYEVYLDGQLIHTSDANAETGMSCEGYTTDVAAHKVQILAVLQNGDKVHSNIRTFYVSKKGISVDTKTVDYPIQNMGESWYYTWGMEPFEQYNGKGEFVPMIWGNSETGMEWLKNAKENGYDTVLGFNEPDLETQANVTVVEAVEQQKKFTDAGLRIGAPVTAGWASSSEWLQEYMSAAGEQVDFIPVHLYLGYPGKEMVKTVLHEIQNTYEKYQKPIWITEISFASTDPYWTGLTADNLEYVRKNAETLEMLVNGVEGEFAGLNQLAYVERYAWFSFDTNHTFGGCSALYETNEGHQLAKGDLTRLGIFYRMLGNPEGYVVPGLDGEIGENDLPADIYVDDKLTGAGQKPGNPEDENASLNQGAIKNPKTEEQNKIKTGDDSYLEYTLLLMGISIFTGMISLKVTRRKK